MRSQFVRSLCCLPFVLALSTMVTCTHESWVDGKVLDVGKELVEETLPLKFGYRLYQLQGLKSDSWYEVKISYPASIPSSFSIQLKRENSELILNRNRRLLNTEKLIFRTDRVSKPGHQDNLYVSVTVEPEGIVAIPHAQERQFVIFNIVCDELLLGIPHKAWWVGTLALLCLGVASIVPCYFPSQLLNRKQSSRPLEQLATKSS